MSATEAISRTGGAAARERLSALALSLAVLFFSGNFIAGRFLRDDVDALTLNFWRW